MTRLQNAKNQLNEALAALESAASGLIDTSQKARASERPSQMSGQTIAGTDISSLVSEVSIIEAKLSEAITMIAAVGSSKGGSNTINNGDPQ